MMTSITRAVQVTPFIYSILFVIAFVVYNFSQGVILEILDALFYVSPLVVVIFLAYSKILHLCSWHRVTCVIPLIPQVVEIIDRIFNLVQYEVIIFNYLLVVLITLLLISAYKVFYGQRNRC